MASPAFVQAPQPPPPAQQLPQTTVAPVRKRSNPAQNPGAPKRKRGRPSKADLALREQAAQGGAPTATWQPQMYTPDQGRGGASLLPAAPGGVGASQEGSIQQQLNQLPPLKKKRGRPTKAEMEARRERDRLELLAAQRVHGGDLPTEVQQQDQQKLEADDGQARRLGNELAEELAGVNADIEEDESEEGGADSPDTED